MRTTLPTHTPQLSLADFDDWTCFWRAVQERLTLYGYSRSSRRCYRSILRQLALSSRRPPCELNHTHIYEYLRYLNRRRCSAHWLAMNISVLRLIFDRCCGTRFLTRRHGPRRPFRLPQILNQSEVRRLLQAVACPRDALLLGLLYGCGLKPGEMQALHWGQFDCAQRTLNIGDRCLPVPEKLLPLIKQGLLHAGADAPVFASPQNPQGLSHRSIARIVQWTAIRAGMIKRVTAMTLRHSYAIHQLQAGVNIRELQMALGHERVKTTMKYLMLVPPEHTSPADVLPELSLEGSEHPFAKTTPLSWFKTWFVSRFIRPFRPPD